LLLLLKIHVREERRITIKGGSFVRQRIQNIFSHCKNPVDLILLKNALTPFVDDNFFYVTGLQQGLFEGCAAVLHHSGDLDLLVSELEAESARPSSANISVYKTKDQFPAELRKLIPAGASVGINSSGLSYQDFCTLKELFPQSAFLDVSVGFTLSRLIKDTEEIRLIRQACTIADETMAAIPESIYEGMSEDELAAEINYSLQTQGAEKPAFDTISSFGKNTAQPHYSHGETTLSTGDCIVCDFGACYKKYNSDITRSFHCGKTNEQKIMMYETVLQAQQIAFDAIHPGARAGDVHQAVHSFIETTPFKGRFIHSTGHCLGLAVHDGVGFAPGSTLELKEHMVLTVEPGVYLPGVGGIRIEDDVLVTKNGMDLLTKSPRDFTELK
jgi:Xaa-Pro dipeptidase